MKILLEILTVVVLLSLGWDQPFRAQYERISGRKPTKAVAAPAADSVFPLGASPVQRPTATPKRDKSWMWGPTKLDQPYR